MHRHPRLGPAVYEVSIVGPVDPVSEAVTQGIVAQRMIRNRNLRSVAISNLGKTQSIAREPSWNRLYVEPIDGP